MHKQVRLHADPTRVHCVVTNLLGCLLADIYKSALCIITSRVSLPVCRRLQECKIALSDSTREVGKLRRELEEQLSENERQTDALLTRHQHELATVQQTLQEKVSVASVTSVTRGRLTRC